MLPLLFLLGLVLGLVSAPEAKTIYVAKASQGGSESRTCVQAENITTPLLRINAGIGCLNSGDTLIVRNGIYDEAIADVSGVGGYSVAVPGGSGESTRTILKSENPLGTTLIMNINPLTWAYQVSFNSSSFITMDGFVIDGQFVSEQAVEVGAHRLRFQNLEITSHRGQGVGGSSSGTDAEFLNINLHHAAIQPNGQITCAEWYCGAPPGELCPDKCHGYYIDGTGHVIDGGQVWRNESRGIQWYVSGGIIRNVDVYDNQNFGIGIYDANNLVENNALSRNGIETNQQSTTIRHNTIVAVSPLVGFGISQNFGAPATMHNNLILQMDASNASYVYVWGGAHGSGNELCDQGYSQVTGNQCDASGQCGCAIIPASPSPIVDQGSDDLHLRAGSPAIAAGVVLPAGQARTDKDGNPRPASTAPDVGAYQFVANGGEPGPAVALQWVQQPTTTAVGAPITPALVVRAIDAEGNTAPSFSDEIQIDIGINAGGGTLSGDRIVTPTDGVSTFANLSITQQGVGYTLTASAPGTLPALVSSNAFTVTSPAGLPAAPSSLRRDADTMSTTGTLTLAWDYTQGTPAATGMVVERQEACTGVFTARPGMPLGVVTTYTDTGLTAANTYCWRVVAVDAGANRSMPSNTYQWSPVPPPSDLSVTTISTGHFLQGK